MIRSAVYEIEQKTPPLGIPAPDIHERPTCYADRMGVWHSSFATSIHKKQFGQYLTPVEVADFMASLVTVQGKAIRILDPGSGTGILTCAVCEYLASQKEKPSQLLLDVYEIDHNLVQILQKTLCCLATYLEKKKIAFAFTIHAEDFILKHAHALKQTPTFFDSPDKEPKFDICISNPPYFKLPKSDKRAQVAASVVHGQPNIYALFMAVSAAMLSENGELVFITPRSFASGSYFRLFRQQFFAMVRPERIHIFDSRRDAFKHEGILQENIILKARRDDCWISSSLPNKIALSASNGAGDINQSGNRILPLEIVLDIKSKDRVLKIPSKDDNKDIFEKMSSWSGSLREYGFEVSTGPVVPFRATQFLSEKTNKHRQYAPLLWLQNVKPMQMTWPLEAQRKQQYIELSGESLSLVVPNKNYVLLRRFSAKEEIRRLIAAPFIGGTLSAEWIGLENHLNYIHKPHGSLSRQEAWGLAILYNSSFFDMYFRMLNGNTQVSATEIRSIPLPSLDIIFKIGERAMATTNIHENIDSIARIAFQDKHTKTRILVHV
jgi:adenine-specific DNA-methyltransferase